MKRSILYILFCLLVVSSLALPVLADDPELPRIVDYADLLTDQEEADLEELARLVRNDWDMDAVIVTVDSLDGKSAQAYADDYYDNNGYGVGSSYSGVLLLIAMDTREWYISTCGDAIGIISDADVQLLFDAMSDHLSGGEYYRAFNRYLKALWEHFGMESGNYDEGPVSTGEAPGIGVKGVLIALGVGLGAGGIGLLILRSGMNTKRKQSGAADYLQKDSYHLRIHRDMFLYSRVSKTRRPKDSGGSTHRSSGGRSHGGRGGRF